MRTLWNKLFIVAVLATRLAACLRLLRSESEAELSERIIPRADTQRSETTTRSADSDPGGSASGSEEDASSVPSAVELDIDEGHAGDEAVTDDTDRSRRLPPTLIVAPPVYYCAANPQPPVVDVWYPGRGRGHVHPRSVVPGDNIRGLQMHERSRPFILANPAAPIPSSRSRTRGANADRLDHSAARSSCTTPALQMRRSCNKIKGPSCAAVTCCAATAGALLLGCCFSLDWGKLANFGKMAAPDEGGGPRPLPPFVPTDCDGAFFNLGSEYGIYTGLPESVQRHLEVSGDWMTIQHAPVVAPFAPGEACSDAPEDPSVVSSPRGHPILKRAGKMGNRNNAVFNAAKVEEQPEEIRVVSSTAEDDGSNVTSPLDEEKNWQWTYGRIGLCPSSSASHSGNNKIEEDHEPEQRMHYLETREPVGGATGSNGFFRRLFQCARVQISEPRERQEQEPSNDAGNYDAGELEKNWYRVLVPVPIEDVFVGGPGEAEERSSDTSICRDFARTKMLEKLNGGRPRTIEMKKPLLRKAREPYANAADHTCSAPVVNLLPRNWGLRTTFCESDFPARGPFEKTIDELVTTGRGEWGWGYRDNFVRDGDGDDDLHKLNFYSFAFTTPPREPPAADSATAVPVHVPPKGDRSLITHSLPGDQVFFFCYNDYGSPHWRARIENSDYGSFSPGTFSDPGRGAWPPLSRQFLHYEGKDGTGTDWRSTDKDMPGFFEDTKSGVDEIHTAEATG